MTKDIYKWWSKKALKNEIFKLKLTYNELFDSLLRNQEENKKLKEENKKLKEELTEWNLIREDCETAFFRRDYLAMHKRVAKAKKIIEKLLKYIFTPEGFEELDKDMIMEAEAFVNSVGIKL